MSLYMDNRPDRNPADDAFYQQLSAGGRKFRDRIQTSLPTSVHRQTLFSKSTRICRSRNPSEYWPLSAILFFSVKISEAAKRNGLALEFVKEGKEVLEKAKTKPSLIVFDLNFETVSPLDLIAN